MKYLDYPLLNELSSSLSSDSTSDLRVHVRFEAYSVKPVGKEKRAFKEREEAYMSEQEGMEEMSFSPEMREAGLASCFGRLDEKESRKVHFLLVSTLNAAFPDHDFTSLRPDHFTRELSAAQVLSYLSGSLLGSSGAGTTPVFLSPVSLLSTSGNNRSPPQASPSNSSPNLGPSVPNADLYRILNEVVPMDECEVYSWFPEPEYDPHIDASTDTSDEEEDDILNEADEDFAMDMDGDAEIPPNWGVGGMDLDVDEEKLESVPMARQNSTSGGGDANGGVAAARRLSESGDWAVGRERRVGGLLWSANYFFYSKRQKRILFLTCYCRNRPFHPAPQVESAFPAPISASFSSPSSSFEHLAPLNNGNAIRTHRYQHHNHHQRKPRSSIRTIGSSLAKGDQSSTIPIRGMEQRSFAAQPVTPRSNRLNSSAPGSYGAAGSGGGTSNQSPMARMMAGGFKPRQTPARTLINAAQANTQVAPGGESHIKAKSTSSSESATTKDQKQDGSIEIGGNSSKHNRTTRERSGSTTPGPGSVSSSTSALTAGLRGNIPGMDKGKRVKV
ncbi:hypothetical protein I316_07906 [Kwoniella heveanensis BCC8398]|uniref:Maf1 regulator n=1 Tax=Kwoniella heveanensis BCC8398 TaxID=1296120 RepID=A0A1B9GHF5_9TREE|nr:hypothetical protein I316_07906 [Kwoniella heveanensis BCC8398]